MRIGDAYDLIEARKAAEKAPPSGLASYAKPVGVIVLIYALWTALKGKK